MAFCENCGKEVNDGVNFCPSCGKAVGAEQQSQNTQADGGTDAHNNKGMAVVAYLLFFIPLLTGAHKTSPFVKYHTNQGTVLFILAIAWSVVYWIITAILTAIFFRSGLFGLWGILNTLIGLLWFVPTILCILGIVNAVKGITKPLPVIGKFRIIK